jgi:Holliday junction DNA helicase RuvB
MSDEVLTVTLALLRERPDLEETLRRITDYEREHYRDEFFRLGWSWDSFDPPIQPQTLHMMHLRGVLRKVYDSRSCTGYLSADPLQVLKALEVFEAEAKPAEPGSTGEIPKDLFSIIYGHEDVRLVFERSLKSEDPIHILLVGGPSSAKSLFLSELNRLPGSAFTLGGLSTKVGLRDLILEGTRYLIIDEIDKIDSSNELSALLSWMESGVIALAKHGEHLVMRGKGWIFAAANRVSGLPPELLSRFWVMHIPPYTDEELRGVIIKVLTEREGKNPELSEYIANKVIMKLRTKDPRDAIKLARISETKEDVDEMTRIMLKYLKRR